MAGELVTRANKVENFTVDHTLTIDDSGGTFTNLGASGEVSFTLPVGCPVGAEFTFIVLASQYLYVVMPPGENKVSYPFILLNARENSDIRANTIGHTCTVVCRQSTVMDEQFIVKSLVGSTWATSIASG